MISQMAWRAVLCTWLTLAAAFIVVDGACAQSLRGVNLSGAEFAPSHMPGRYGWDYTYPTDGEITYFTGKGMNVFRVPVRWERLQPTLNGPLDPKELARLQQFVVAAKQHGASVVIDIHNYGSFHNIGIEQNPALAGAFADLWRRVAVAFGSDPDVLFGLMNEPKVKDIGVWQTTVQHTIDTIRAAGARNTILVSGTDWDGAHNFVTVSGASLNSLADPQHRLVFEVHQYFDKNFSGTNAACIDPDQAVATLTPFTQWLRANKHQGFLGEFGVSQQPACLAVLDRVAAYLKANADVWRGWTYWAAGPRWGNYMFTLEPDDGQDRPQMLVLQKYLYKKP
jgi:endoglucanase